MRNYFHIIILLALVTVCTSYDAGAVKLEDGAAKSFSPASNRLVVKFKPNAALAATKNGQGVMETGNSAFDALNAQFGVRDQRPLLEKAQLATSNHPLGDVVVLEFQSAADLEQAARMYEELGIVEYAHPDGELELFLTQPAREVHIPIKIPRLFPNPTDPLYYQQWSQHNAGSWFYTVERHPNCGNDVLSFEDGTAGADLDYSEVYQDPPVFEGDVVVAIIDTGVDLDHPDMFGKIWQNPGEIADNGIDDDHNGYIDDIVGWDYSANDVSGYPVYEDNDPTDHRGHGTHCAGIVAAGMDNGIGISGMVPKATIMCLKISPIMTFSMAARAIVYAADNGADVINMSWGAPYEMAVVSDALDYARAHGVVLVAAAGNSGDQTLNYPAAFPQSIAVGATDGDDLVTSFSTFNSYVNVAAPGAAILSLRADLTDMYGPCEPDVHVRENNYYIASGTSMSAPHVVGVAAYLRSVAPGLNPIEVQDIIQNSAEDLLDPYGTGQSLPGWDMYSGHGRVNLKAALDMAPSLRAILKAPATFEVVSGLVAITGTARGGDFTGYELSYGEGAQPVAWTPILSSVSQKENSSLGTWDTTAMTGEYTLRLAVNDRNFGYARVFVANQTVAEILTPGAGETVSNLVPITGTAITADFDHYELAYGAADGSGSWTTIVSQSQPEFGGQLGLWDVSNLSAQDYELRLEVSDGSGVVASTVVDVTVGAAEASWSAPLYGTSARSANYGDFDNDGANEIIIGTDNGILVFNIDGTPKTTGLPVFPDNAFHIAIAVGNLDGDGIDDIVAVDSQGTLWGWPSAAPAFSTDLQVVPRSSVGSGSPDHRIARVFLRDVDGDGTDEIHYYPGDAGSAAWFYTIRESDGSARSGFPLAHSYHSGQPADLNGDGQDEIYAFGGMVTQFDLAGNLVASVALAVDGDPLVSASFSAVDIDDDGKAELIVQGAILPASGDNSWWVFALDEGLVVKAGWPHSLNIDTYLVLEHVNFGDLDDDGELEYVTTNYDTNTGYVHAWNLDGSPLLSGGSGEFAHTADPGIMFGSVLVDLDGVGGADILAASGSDVFLTSNVEYLHAWSADGVAIQDFPQPIATNLDQLPRNMNVPMVGDFDEDGNIDIVYPSGVQDLRFISLIGQSYDQARSPAPMWFYNQRMNGIFIPGETPQMDAIELAGLKSVKYSFQLEDNFPNPFNPNTKIGFSLKAAGMVYLDIFDVSGKRVAGLVSEEMSAGRHEVQWNGQDSTGGPVASGNYFFRLRTDQGSMCKKMLLLK